MKNSRWITLLLTVLMIVSTFVVPVSAKESSALDPETIAVEAYVYLYPLVLMDLSRLQMINFEEPTKEFFQAPMNQFSHARAYPPAEWKTVVRPNFDTLYSSLWLDRTTEPMIVSLPDSQGRYYLWPSIDMWTDVTAVPGWRTIGTGACHSSTARRAGRARCPRVSLASTSKRPISGASLGPRPTGQTTTTPSTSFKTA